MSFDEELIAHIARSMRRYNVRIVPRVFEPDDADLPEDFEWGPGGDNGLSLSERKVIYEPIAECEYVLHEAMHVVLGEKSLEIDEGWLLMPFEWIFAKHLASSLPKKIAKRFIQRVHNYQGVTTVGRYEETIFAYRNARRQRWWRAGVQRAIVCGLLDERERVTFRPPDYSKLIIPDLWDPEDDSARKPKDRS